MFDSSDHIPWVINTLSKYLGIKQNNGHAWLLGPDTLGKLILFIIYLSIKQNLSHA